MHFGEKIKRARQELELRQIDVANAIGMNQSNYSKIEKGDQEPNLQQLKGICETLHIDANYLLNISDDNLSRKDALLLSEIKCLIEKYGKK
jgi:transcriptional regulator with XRE-family HTH domain